jgi:hypothetical protein
MKHYVVTWDIDIEADNPHDAAIEARKIQLRCAENVGWAISNVFTVEDDNGVTVTIDLQENR